jgi:hypothetical protein
METGCIFFEVRTKRLNINQMSFGFKGLTYFYFFWRNIQPSEVRCEVDSAGAEYGPVAGSYEHGTESSGSIKGGEFLDQPSDCQLLKKYSASWS